MQKTWSWLITHLKTLPLWAQLSALGLVGLSLGLSTIFLINHRQAQIAEKSGARQTANSTFKRQLFGPYAYAAQAGPLTTRLDSNKTGVKLSVAHQQSEVQFQTPLSKVTAKQETDDSLVFTTDNKLVTIKYRSLKNGIKETIILNDDPHTTQFMSTISLKNTEPRITPDGQIVFINADGDYQFHLQQPWAKDSAGNITYGLKYKIYEKPSPKSQQQPPTTPALPDNYSQLSPEGIGRQLLGPIDQAQQDLDLAKEYVLMLEVDPAWLQSPKREYPIIIDPTVVHDESSEFSSGQFNRVSDTGSGSSPQLETYYQELPADEHTVGLWHMNNDWTDSSGEGNNGTATGGTTFTTSAKLGSHSGSFDGSNDYVDLGAYTIANLLNGASTITLSAWVKPDTYPGGTSRERIINIHIDGDGGGTTTGASLSFYGTDEIELGGRSVDSDSFQTIRYQFIDTDSWHHLTGIIDYPNDEMRIYIDGELVKTSSVSFANTSFTKGTENQGVDSIGGADSGFGAQDFVDGLIDEVRISNIARTQEEIRAAASRRPYSVYTSPVIDLTSVSSWNDLAWTENGVQTGDGETLSSSTSLLAHWKFNETSGTTADNAEGTASFDGALSGFDSTASQDADPDSGWTANNARWPASNPAALMFDNTDSYVNIGDENTVDSANALSMCAWVKHRTTSDDDYIASKAETSVGWSGFWFLRDETGQESGRTDIYKIAICQNASTCAYVEGATDSAANHDWNHVCFTYTENNSTGLRLYVNGVEDPYSPASTTGITSIDASTDDLFIGRYKTGHWFSGAIDAVTLYSRVLSADEILANYNASNIQFQTRVGADSSPDDGSWEAWRPTTNETSIEDFDSDATNWSWDNLASNAPVDDSDDSTTYMETTGSLKITNTPQTDANTVALYHLDETNGDLAGVDIFDETTNNNDGEFNGTGVATAVVDGVTGKARDFNGSDDWIEANDVVGEVSSSSLTLEAWVKSTAHSSNDGAIFGFNDSSGGNRLLVFLSSTNFSIYDGSFHDGPVINDGAWHHVAAVLNDSGNNIKGYVDGKKEIDFSSSASISSSDTLSIGMEYDGASTSDHFDGSIDEVRISNTTRTAEEIAEAYRAGRDHYLNRTISSTNLSSKTSLPFYVAADRPGTYLEATIGESAYANYQPDTNTVGLWHLDEGTDNACNSGNDDACDASSNGNHGDIFSAPSVVRGKIGKARDFDGSDDYISLPDEAGQYPTGNFTLSAWIKPETLTGTDYDTIFDINFAASSTNSRNGGIVFGPGWRSAATDELGVSFVVTGHQSQDANTYTSTAVLTTGNWQFVNVVRDGGQTKFYVNGKLDSTHTSDVGNIIYDSSAYDDNSVNIGKMFRSGASNHEFDGIIDEARIDNTARSASEIRQAYEVGRRTHPITIDFAASLDSGNLITGSGDTSFTVDATAYGLEQKGDALYLGDKIIVRENYAGTEYIAQGTVTAVTPSTGAVTVTSWDSGSTFPTSGFTANASVFKWQREYWDITNPLDSHLNAATNLTLRFTNGAEGRTVWLDDLKSNTNYLTTPGGSTITSSTGNRYFQYRAILASSDEAVSADFDSVTLDYVSNNAPNTPSLDSPTDTATDQATTPALKTTATDSDSDYLQYKIELCENEAMTTNCQTFNQSSSQTGWSGQNAGAGTAYTSGTQATYTVQSALDPNTTYYWRSYALDPAGTNTWSSTQSTPYSFTTSPIQQASECTIEEATDDSSLTISWVDNESDEAGFEIKRSVNGGAYSTLTTKPANATSHVDSGVSQGNTYQYKIAAYQTGPVYSEWCETPPSQPLSLQSGNFKFEGLQMEGLRLD